MSTPNNTQIPPKPRADRRNTAAAGIVLIAAGAGMLLFQRLDLFQYFMLLLGGGMTLLGILTRTAGWMIPGGVVGGIGLGIALMESPLTSAVPSVDEGGLFLMCMAAGFASITLFTKLFAGENHPWALIPAGIMAFIGGMVLLKGPGLKVLEVIGSYWPAALILVGGYILYKAFRSKPE